MLGLKTIWTKKKSDDAPQPLGSASTSSIARQVVTANRPSLPPVQPVPSPVSVDTRAAERFVPRRTATVIITDSGKKHHVRIINVSIMGVAVEADFTQIPAQAIVMVGERRVRPGRKISRGFVFLFEVPLPHHLCGPDLVV